MINFDENTVNVIDNLDFKEIELLITTKNNRTKHKTFKFTEDYETQHIDYVTKCVLGDLYHFNTFHSIVDVKCPQNIVDRSIKFCKKYKGDFLFAIAGVYGVTIYIKKHNKVKDFDKNVWYKRYHKYFWKKYKIIWTIVEV